MTLTETPFDLAHLFPWGVGEMRAALALCPPAAFHVHGLRLERVPDGWWGELATYREDHGVVVIWPGLRVRRGRGWEIVLPPYLADLDGAWRALLGRTVQRLVLAAVDTPGLGDALFVTATRPLALPHPGDVGGDRVTPCARSLLAWIARAKRYRFAAALSHDGAVLDLGCGLGDGSRLLARAARHVVATDAAPDVVAYAARAHRSPRLAFAASGEAAVPAGSMDVVTCLDGVDTAAAADAVIAEAARALVAGGCLVVTAARGGALTDEALARTLAARFEAVETWWQRPAAVLGEVTDEREIVPACAPGARLVAVARGARRGAPRAWRPPAEAVMA